MKNQYSYDEIQSAILNGHHEIQITYKNQLYWILIGKKCFFGDIDGNISLHFLSPHELISAILVDGKRLIEMWNDVEVESYEGGWNRTENL